MNQRGYGISREVQTTDISRAIGEGVGLAEAYERSPYVTRFTPARDPRLDSAPAELHAKKAKTSRGGLFGALRFIGRRGS